MRSTGIATVFYENILRPQRITFKPVGIVGLRQLF